MTTPPAAPPPPPIDIPAGPEGTSLTQWSATVPEGTVGRVRLTGLPSTPPASVRCWIASPEGELQADIPVCYTPDGILIRFLGSMPSIRVAVIF